MTMMRTHCGGSLVVIRSWMNWRPLAASWIHEDMVGRSRGENMGPIREHWMVQRSSKTLGSRNRMLKKPIERIERVVLSLLGDRVYICN